jgi:hypothetical protein
LLSVIVMLCLKLGTGLLSALAMLITQGIPAGTALPVMLGGTLDAKKDKPGEKIEARLMQDVRLPAGDKIKAGAYVIGHIVAVTRLPGGGSRMVLVFDHLTADGRTIPLVLSVRAIASSNSVFQAQVPINTNSDAESSNQWAVQQVGGEVVNRRLGLVGSDYGVVGRYDEGAPWGKLTTAVDGDCSAADGNGIVQALWVFSTSACGLYGLRDMKLVHDGRTDPAGQIILESSKDLHIGGGSGWFLLVGGTPAAAH